nr:hypothetical protein [Tanacetum cinerariifolium]
VAHSENNTLSSAFKTFFERETLTGLNFNEWYRSLRIVLRVADTFDYLYNPCPDQPADTATEAEKVAFRAEYKKHSDVACIMLGKMLHALQRKFENYPPQNMLAELQKIFEKPPAVEIYDVVDALQSCRQAHELCITAYGESQQISLENSKDCVDARVRLLNIPCVGKNDADRVIMCDMYVFAFDSPPPAYVMLILGDGDFISAFKGLRDLGYTALSLFRKDR